MYLKKNLFLNKYVYFYYTHILLFICLCVEPIYNTSLLYKPAPEALSVIVSGLTASIALQHIFSYYTKWLKFEVEEEVAI